MADASNRSAKWIKTFVLYVIAVSGVVAPFSSAQCVDGSYGHDGRDCCLCPAGQYLVEHCTENLQYGKCELCQVETYSSEPSSQMSCEPCTSCSHQNDNLEEEEPCTPARNRMCRCRQDHYCSSRAETCRLCHPCTTCDPEDIKVACTANNDTVCNRKTTGTGGIIAGVAAVVVVAVVGLCGFFVYRYYRKRKCRQQSITTTNPTDEATQPLTEVNLHPHLPDIADIIGWTDMKDIAISTNVLSATIESFKLDNPGQSREQTLQLLTHFNEKHSRMASRVLIENLKRRGKNDKADRVQRLLANSAGVVESA